MSKRRSKIELRHNDRAPTITHGPERLIITTPSGMGFMIDVEYGALTVRANGIDNLTIEPGGSNMVTLRRRRP